MSNPCEHNNHGHVIIWLVLAWGVFDCSGHETRQQNEIESLKSKVQQLEARRP